MGRQEIARAITGMCRTENGIALMTDDESVKDLLSSFKDKENTLLGRRAIACAIFRICYTTAGSINDR